MIALQLNSKPTIVGHVDSLTAENGLHSMERKRYKTELTRSLWNIVCGIRDTDTSLLIKN